jgi:hypothetical protein
LSVTAAAEAAVSMVAVATGLATVAGGGCGGSAGSAYSSEAPLAANPTYSRSACAPARCFTILAYTFKVNAESNTQIEERERWH